jgi:hypothetical protein
MSEKQEPPPIEHISIAQRLFPYETFRQDRDTKFHTLILATILAISTAIWDNFNHQNTQTGNPLQNTQTEKLRPAITPENGRLIKLREAA